VVEVMGRDCGYIALQIRLAGRLRKTSSFRKINSISGNMPSKFKREKRANKAGYPLCEGKARATDVAAISEN